MKTQRASTSEDTLIYFGEAVKALDDNGRAGGYLVRFSDAEHKDLADEYFTEETYLGPSEGDGAESLFDHGFPLKSGVPELEELADHTFAPLKTKRDKIGIWAETVLDLADEYERAVFAMVKKGKLGWSSGAPGHRVRKDADGKITRWPIAEGSLTPRPAEPLNRAIAMKSLAAVKFVALGESEDGDDSDVAPASPFQSNTLTIKLNRIIDDLVDADRDRGAIVKSLAREASIETEEVEGILSGASHPSDARLKAFARALGVSFDQLKTFRLRDHARTIKGMFEEALADQTPSRWQLDSVYSDIIRKLAQTAQASNITGVDFDLEGKVKEATEEYMGRLEKLAIGQINEYVESGSDEPFYLKAIIDPTSDLPVSGSLDLSDHSQLAVSVLRDVVKRFWANHKARQREATNQKAGRVLSAANRTRLSTMLEQIQTAVADCQKLLEESQPMASDAEKRAAQTHLLRLEMQAAEIERGAARIGIATN